MVNLIEGVISLVGSFLSQRRIEKFRQNLRSINLPSPPKFWEQHKYQKKLAEEMLEVNTTEMPTSNNNTKRFVACHFSSGHQLDTLISDVLQLPTLQAKVTGLSFIVDDGLGTTKAALVLTSETHSMERFVITAIAKSKECSAVYDHLLRKSNLPTLGALSKIANLPFTISGDIKSLSLMIGTAVQSTYPCPLCLTPKKLKIGGDRSWGLFVIDTARLFS